LLALAPRDELVSFVKDTLAPLDAIESRRREELTQTLELLFTSDLNVAATARAGGWHYNTVRYRIRSLIDLLGPFLEDGERLQSITLAMLIRRELTATHAESSAPPQPIRDA
jgi:DNA-binding PucR family transcriptional regulator